MQRCYTSLSTSYSTLCMNSMMDGGIKSSAEHEGIRSGGWSDATRRAVNDEPVNERRPCPSTSLDMLIRRSITHTSILYPELAIGST